MEDIALPGGHCHVGSWEGRWYGYSTRAQEPFQTRAARILSCLTLRKKKGRRRRSQDQICLKRSSFSSKVQWSAPCHSPRYKGCFLCFKVTCASAGQSHGWRVLITCGVPSDPKRSVSWVNMSPEIMVALTMRLRGLCLCVPSHQPSARRTQIRYPVMSHPPAASSSAPWEERSNSKAEDPRLLWLWKMPSHVCLAGNVSENFQFILR